MRINEGGMEYGRIPGYGTAKEHKPLNQTPAQGMPADSISIGKGAFSIDDLHQALSCLPRRNVGTQGDKIMEQKTVQYADSYGRVKHLALQLSSYASGKVRTQMLNAYKTLFQKMEPDTKFSIVVESDRDQADVEKILKDNKIPNPERIQFIKPNVGGLTVWARDQMIGMYLPDDPNHTGLLNQTTLHNWHDSDTKVPPKLAEANPKIILDREPRLVTDGGDTVSNRNESFVGYYSLAATAENLHRVGRSNNFMKTQMVAHYETKTGNKVVLSEQENPFPYKIVPEPFPKDIHRIPFRLESNPDYQTLKAGGNQVDEATMYEDMAKELFEKQFGKKVSVMGKDDPSTPQIEEPASDHMDMGMTPVDEKTFMLGSPDLAKSLFRSMTPGELRQAEQVLSDAAGKKIDLKSYLETSRKGDKQNEFDAYEKKLSGEGYRVVRVPHAEPGWGSPYITYNNCLMERFDKNNDGTEYRRIFLPVYGIPKLDNFAIDAYKKEGFEVIPMPLDALSARWGALRCISNWLERSPQG